jgi:hypothetical protein
MGEYEQQMNLALRPVAPPRVPEGLDLIAVSIAPTTEWLEIPAA